MRTSYKSSYASSYRPAYDVVVLGGGITGLTVAYWLAKEGKSVLIIEKEKELGGSLRSIRRPNYSIEEYYHHILLRDKHTRALINELGLSSKLEYYKSRPSFIYDDCLFELGSPFDLLRFKKLSFFQRIRLIIFLARFVLINDYKSFDDIKLVDYLINNVGEEVFNVFFKEMLTGKFGRHYKEIAASWFVGRVLFRSTRKGSYEMLGYLDDGFSMLIDEIRKRIKGKVDVLFNTKLSKIIIQDNQAFAIKISNKLIKLKYLVSTIPPSEVYDLADNNSSVSKLRHLPSQGAIVIVIGTKRRITNNYWNNIMAPGTIVKAVIEHTNLVGDEKYNEHLLYLTSYPDSDSRLWKMNDKQIFKSYLDDLNNSFSQWYSLAPDDINWYCVRRLKNAGLIYRTGILRLLPGLRPDVSNLFIGGMLTQFPERSIEESIKQANRIVELIISESK